jgi:hypothetical protein
VWVMACSAGPRNPSDRGLFDALVGDALAACASRWPTPDGPWVVVGLGGLAASWSQESHSGSLGVAETKPSMAWASARLTWPAGCLACPSTSGAAQHALLPTCGVAWRITVEETRRFASRQTATSVRGYRLLVQANRC